MLVRKLAPELEKVAREDLDEDPKKLEDGIEHLKEWIGKQTHLKARTDDQWLASFLRGCKFNLDRTKQKMDLYYSIKSKAPELNCLNPRDPKFIEILKSGIFLVLPKTAQPGAPRVTILRIGKFDPSKNSYYEVMSVFHFVYQILLLEDDNFAVAGVVSMVDFEGTSFSHFTGVTPGLLKKMIMAYQDAAPVRIKGSHFLNAPRIFDLLYKFLKSFLNEKIQRRFFIHRKNSDTLYQHIPIEILPAEYGGSGGTIQGIVDNWVNKIEAYREWFEQESQFGSDESKRPSKIITTAADLKKSFKDLEFD